MMKYDRILDDLRESDLDELNYSKNELEEAIRKSLTPFCINSSQDLGVEYTTPVIQAQTPEIIDLTALIVRGSNGWEKVNNRYIYKGLNEAAFIVSISTSLLTSANNEVLSISLYKNGNPQNGLSITRKIGAGADIGSLSALGMLKMLTDDYIEIVATTDSDTTITFKDTSFLVNEK